MPTTISKVYVKASKNKFFTTSVLFLLSNKIKKYDDESQED